MSLSPSTKSHKRNFSEGKSDAFPAWYRRRYHLRSRSRYGECKRRDKFQLPNRGVNRGQRGIKPCWLIVLVIRTVHRLLAKTIHHTSGLYLHVRGTLNPVNCQVNKHRLAQHCVRVTPFPSVWFLMVTVSFMVVCSFRKHETRKCIKGCMTTRSVALEHRRIKTVICHEAFC